MTSLRRQVLAMLLQRARPTGAYELIEAMKRETDRPVGPPTVYRALEFLTMQGLVAKVESCHAYIPCAHPDSEHDCIFLICGDCGTAVELEDPRIERLLCEAAASLGFSGTRRTVEVQGTCAHCSNLSSD